MKGTSGQGLENTMSSDSHVNILSGPRFEGPRLRTSLGAYLIECLKRNGDKILQICPDENLTQTNKQILRASINMALEMRARGVKMGDVVTVCTGNQSQAILPVLASIYLGVATNMLHLLNNTHETMRMLKRARPRIIFCDMECQEKYRKMMMDLGQSAEIVAFHRDMAPFLADHIGMDTFEAVDVNIQRLPAVIMCSSGSTGFIKGIVHTHKSLYYAVQTSGFDFVEKDALLVFAPLCWGAALLPSLAAIFYGCKSIIMEFKNWEQALDQMEKYRVSWFMVHSAGVYDLMKCTKLKTTDLSALKAVWVGGNIMTAPQIEEYRAVFTEQDVLNAYGSTESMMTYTYFPTAESRQLAITKGAGAGFVAPEIRAKIVDPKTGEILGRNQTGEVCFKGPSMFVGYFHEPSADASSFDKDGWFKTGDAGYFDDDGCLFVTARLKECIKYRVYPVIPGEIEYILQQHPGVESACVLGLPHHIDGDLPMAFVVRKPGATVTELGLVRHVDAQVNDYQRLRGGVRFIDEMPRTANGKIRRMQLQQSLLD